MKRIAVLTGGGDAPGLNAVIRAVVKTAINDYNCEVLGVQDGVNGFLVPNGILRLDISSVRGILPLGGTILGTANRGNPFARKIIVDGKEVVDDVSHIASELFDKGVPVIGVPKTIDNDVGGTEVTFGFDTALSIASEALDRLHTTAESHHRAMVLELMGRDAGFIALHAGVSGGADVVLIPEIPFHYESVLKKVHQRNERGSRFSLLAVSEGAHPAGGEVVYSREGDELAVPRLGGIGQAVSKYIEAQGIESRVVVLGHLQRGGSPTAYDRFLATRYGAAAVRTAAEGRMGHMVALRNGKVTDIPLIEALKVPRRVDINGDAMRTARGIGISFGDD
jgi:phosphofructokinase-like protein